MCMGHVDMKIVQACDNDPHMKTLKVTKLD